MKEEESYCRNYIDGGNSGSFMEMIYIQRLALLCSTQHMLRNSGPEIEGPLLIQTDDLIYKIMSHSQLSQIWYEFCQR
jgi:hypothetical protein